MTDQQYLDFISAAGEEIGQVLSPLVGTDGASPHDCYSVLSEMLGNRFTPEILSRLDPASIEHLRAAFCRYFESDGITTAHLRLAIERTLLRWPPSRGPSMA